jgi:bifunctional DNase/RNase
MKKIEKKRDLVVPIIIDAILFARISDKMMGVLNAFNPTIHDFEFEPEMQYNGSSNAVSVLNIKDENLGNILGSIFFDLAYGNKTTKVKKSKLEARELANIIFTKWLKAIKKYNSSYKIAV